MKRREFITLLGGAVGVAARGASAAVGKTSHHWEMQKCLMQIVCFFFA
jgi:hypothetical protein